MRIQLGTEDLHVMPLSNCEFCENPCSETHTSVQKVNNILPHFLKYSSLVDIIGTRVHKNYFTTMTFVDTSCSCSSSTTTTTTTTTTTSIGTTAHRGLWPVEQCPSIFSYLPPTLSIFSLPALEDLFLLPLSIFSWVFPFFSSLPVLEWRSF